jgi:hypothetical protein
MKIPIIRTVALAGIAMLFATAAATAADEGLSPALEKRLAEIEKKSTPPGKHTIRF